MNRLQPWLQKARVNQTKNQNIMHELRKVTLLSSKEEKYTVSKEDHRQGESDDEDGGQRDYMESMMNKKKARFVMPEEAQERLNMIQQYNPDNIKKQAAEEKARKEEREKRARERRLST